MWNLWRRLRDLGARNVKPSLARAYDYGQGHIKSEPLNRGQIFGLLLLPWGSKGIFQHASPRWYRATSRAPSPLLVTRLATFDLQKGQGIKLSAVPVDVCCVHVVVHLRVQTCSWGDGITIWTQGMVTISKRHAGRSFRPSTIAGRMVAADQGKVWTYIAVSLA